MYYSSGSLYLYDSTVGSDYPYEVPHSVPAYLSGSTSDLAVAPLAALITGSGSNSTFGFVPSTNGMTAHGLPLEKATALHNLAQNDGPDDSVSHTSTSQPTTVLVTLAALGRNPTDITIPTQAGSEGSGGDDDDDAETGDGGATTGTTVAYAGASPSPATDDDSSTNDESTTTVASTGSGDSSNGELQAQGDVSPAGSHLSPALEGTKAFLGSIWHNTFGGPIEDGKKVWANTAGQDMNPIYRGYVAVGTGVGSFVGVRQVSDACSKHDAVDGHVQTTTERVFKGVTGGVQLVTTAVPLAKPIGGALGLTERSAANAAGHALQGGAAKAAGAEGAIIAEEATAVLKQGVAETASDVLAPGTARATGGTAARFNPAFEVRISAAKSGAAIETQMDRITGKVAQRMGIPEAEDRAMFRLADEFGQVSGGSGLQSGSIAVDSGVLNPASVLNAPELSQLSLRSRIQVILVHEAEEIPLLQQLGDPLLSHPLTVREAAITSPLRVSSAAEGYLLRWSELGPFRSGMR